MIVTMLSRSSAMLTVWFYDRISTCPVGHQQKICYVAPKVMLKIEVKLGELGGMDCQVNFEPMT